MTTKKPKTKKPLRSREYTGPKTVDGVWEYLHTDAYQKAKTKAIESLSKAQFAELWERIRHKTLKAIELQQEQLDALAKARGYKRPVK